MYVFRNILAAVSLISSSFGYAHSSSSSSSNSSDSGYDYVIIGSGTAGSALAAQLSNPDPKTGKYKNSVLVLEAGVNLSNDPAVLHLNTVFATGPLSFNPKYSKTYTPLVQENNAAPYTEGRMWGGGSGHNGLQAYRGTPRLYNLWATFTGDSRWSYNSLLDRIMKPMEHYTPDGTTSNLSQRGTNGPLFITQEPPIDSDPFMVAMQKGLSTSTGFPSTTPFVSDLNDPSLGDIGIGANQDWVTPPWNTPQSIRSFSANAFLTGTPSEGIAAIVDSNGRGLHGRKLRIISNATVNRITFDKKKVAKKVEYFLTDSSDQVKSVKIKKKVILCAGTTQDVAILQRSGVGDKVLLDSLDIPVVYNNSNVGANVQNHYGPQAVILNPSQPFNLPAGQIGSGFTDLGLAPFGVRRYQLFVFGTVINAAGTSTVADSQAFPKGLRTTQLAMANPLSTIPAVILAGVNVVPKSLGTIQIVSKNPFYDPLVNFNQYTDGGASTPLTDASLAVQFLQTVVPAIVAQTGGFIINYDPTGTPDQILQAAMSNNLLTYHASGSCRMSPTAATGVVDSRLHVHGVHNVMVADNAVAPVIEDGNPAYQAFVIGLEAAHILGAHLSF